MNMSDLPVILVNHLLEPPVRITGITRYLFALLEELVPNNTFQYVLATTWRRADLPESLRATSITGLTKRFIKFGTTKRHGADGDHSRLMRDTKATLEFNCNPIGCFWPFWPRIITVHDLYYDLMPREFPRLRRISWHFLFARALDAASAIICVSEASRHQLVNLYPGSVDKAVVIHEAGALKDDADANALNTNSAISAEDKPYALYVGNISPNKNPAILVEALKLLEQRGKSVTLYHIGRDDVALLADAQRRCRLKHPIRSIGTVSDAVLAASYREAHCLVNTSLDEGFCLPILEAQSRGIPVICSDIPVLHEIAGDGALFFSPTDPAALAEAISALFSNVRLHASMVNRAHQNARLFSWRRAAVETETIFRNVLDQRSRNPR